MGMNVVHHTGLTSDQEQLRHQVSGVGLIWWEWLANRAEGGEQVTGNAGL